MMQSLEKRIPRNLRGTMRFCALATIAIIVSPIFSSLANGQPACLHDTDAGRASLIAAVTNTVRDTVFMPSWNRLFSSADLSMRADSVEILYDYRRVYHGTRRIAEIDFSMAAQAQNGQKYRLFLDDPNRMGTKIPLRVNIDFEGTECSKHSQTCGPRDIVCSYTVYYPTAGKVAASYMVPVTDAQRVDLSGNIPVVANWHFGASVQPYFGMEIQYVE